MKYLLNLISPLYLYAGGGKDGWGLIKLKKLLSQQI
jgi:hypothetical protein